MLNFYHIKLSGFCLAWCSIACVELLVILNLKDEDRTSRRCALTIGITISSSTPHLSTPYPRNVSSHVYCGLVLQINNSQRIHDIIRMVVLLKPSHTYEAIMAHWCCTDNTLLQTLKGDLNIGQVLCHFHFHQEAQACNLHGKVIRIGIEVSNPLFSYRR